MDEKLIRAREVAKFLDISRSQAYHLFRNGEIETIHIGKSVRCQADALERFIAAHKNAGVDTGGVDSCRSPQA